MAAGRSGGTGGGGAGQSYARALTGGTPSIQPRAVGNPTKDGVTRDGQGFISITSSTRNGDSVTFRCPNHVPPEAMQHVQQHHRRPGTPRSYFLPGLREETIREMALTTSQRPAYWKVDECTDKQIFLFREWDRAVGIHGASGAMCTRTVVVAKKNGWMKTTYPVREDFTPDENNGGSRRSSCASSRRSSTASNYEGVVQERAELTENGPRAELTEAGQGAELNVSGSRYNLRPRPQGNQANEWQQVRRGGRRGHRQ